MDSENTRSSKPKVVTAALTGCSRLNVRSAKSTDASVVGIIGVSDYIKVNLSDSSGEWINVIEPCYGYAMRKYLKVS